ncbi:MAG: conjugal transfer protein TraF [Thermodesulfobacteriota bacterium]
MNMKKLAATTLLALLSAAGPQEARAMDTFMLSSRAAGMGGAGVACSTDTSAQYYNPATFGFFARENRGPEEGGEENLARKDWGLEGNIGAGGRIHGDIGDFLDTLAAVDEDSLANNGIQSAEDIRSLIRLADALSEIDDERNAFSAQSGSGGAARFRHFGVGVYFSAQTAGWVSNLNLLQLGVSSSDLSSEIEAQGADPGAVYSYQVFSPEQEAQLLAAGYSEPAIRILDQEAAGVGVLENNSAQFAEILVNIREQAGDANINNNATTVIANGFGLVEVPFTYGLAVNDHLAVGGNIKYMRGRVYGSSRRVMDDENDRFLDDIDSHYEETSTFGVDVGVMGRLGIFQAGLVARHLNSPTFDGFHDATPVSGPPRQVAEVEVEPQATLGVALLPTDTLTVALDYDLTANPTIRPQYKTRFIRAGLEWDVIHFLALRLGVYENLEEDDIGLVYTAGLGLNLWAVRLDVAGAYAADEVIFDEEEVPSEAYVMGRLAMDF